MLRRLCAWFSIDWSGPLTARGGGPALDRALYTGPRSVPDSPRPFRISDVLYPKGNP